MLTRLVRTQLVIFTIASIVGLLVMAFQYMQVQTFLGIGRMNVTLELPETGGLYRFSNVTYRGVQVGEVTNVDVTKTGARATLTLDRSARIPADLVAQVRSVSAVGEQYVDLLPRTASPPFLHDGSVIRAGQQAIPQPVGPMLDQVSALVGSIPKERLHDVLDELFTGFNGAEYDLQSLVDSTAKLSGDLNPAADQARSLLDDSRPLLDSQDQSTDAIRIWTRSLTGVTDQLVTNDPQVRTLLQKGPGSAQEVSRLLDQTKLTIPVLLANLETLGQIAVTYHPGIEQLLVLLPPIVSIVQAVQPNRNASGLGPGSFRISGFSDPPVCTVGFLPPSSWRPPYETSTIDTPDDLYCKLPQDSPIAVRGLRNFPCMNKPGKRAPTVEICNSDQEYEPIAQRQPPIGPYPRDPNLESQGIPPDSRWFPDQGLYSPPGQGPSAPEGPAPPPPPPDSEPSHLPPNGPPEQSGHAGTVPPISGPPAPPGATPPPTYTPSLPDFPAPASATPSSFHGGNSPPDPAVRFAQYNPRTGEYLHPDGRIYRQSDLVPPAVHKTWKDLVLAS